jgi:hypothetical protein
MMISPRTVYTYQLPNVDDILVGAFHESVFKARHTPQKFLKCIVFSTFAVKAISLDYYIINNLTYS